MSVLVSVVGGNLDSDEYRAALKLKNIIQESVPQNVTGEIVLFASASLVGQTVKDVDLFMLGTIQNYELNLEFVGDDETYIKDTVSVNSFCTTIEIKSHGIEAISRVGTDFYVKYGKTKHCVTEQSNNQKTSDMFTRVKVTMGELTRQRIEMISRKGISVDNIIPQNGKCQSVEDELEQERRWHLFKQQLGWLMKTMHEFYCLHITKHWCQTFEDFLHFLNYQICLRRTACMSQLCMRIIID